MLYISEQSMMYEMTICFGCALFPTNIMHRYDRFDT